MRSLSFTEDCEGELCRHKERCKKDPEYCLAYIQAYSYPYGFVFPTTALDQLSDEKRHRLILQLEGMLHAGFDGAMMDAIRSLLEHVKRLDTRLEDFAKAIARLSNQAVC